MKAADARRIDITPRALYALATRRTNSRTQLVISNHGNATTYELAHRRFSLWIAAKRACVEIPTGQPIENKP